MPAGESRLFVAFPAPEAFKEHGNQCRKLNSDHQNIRWVPLDNYHITLFFLGEVKDEHQPQLISTIEQLISLQKPVSIEYDKLTFEGRASHPSMIWERFHTNTEFTKLYSDIFEAVKHYTKENNKFDKPVPHITVARIKSAINTSDFLFPEEIHKIEISINRCQLWKTISIPGGVKYETISEFRFANS